MALDKKDILRRNLDAFCAKDWNTYKSTLTDDSIYEEEATNRRAQGRDEVVKLLRGWTDAFPDIRADLKEMVVSGDSVVAEIEWSGTQNGPLSGPMGTIPPTGKHGKVSAVEVVRFDGDRIREVRHYFDLMTILAQLGVLPRPTVQPPAP